ncbi:MAG: hypothetical protein M3Y54_00465 [Bacteroidota bacterium]|nr:hypothetical protein [Bacteroidota bacterium]
METPCQHLELVFLASTVTPAWGVGWAFTTTPAPRPRPTHSARPARLRLAIVAAS